MAVRIAVRGVAHRGRRVALAVGVVLALLLVLAQLLLPGLAAQRVRTRMARYGTIYSVHISAWPALELLWGHADSVRVSAGPLSATQQQVAEMLSEARHVGSATVAATSATLTAPELARGVTVRAVRMSKRGSAIAADATVTQNELDVSLPSGVAIEPTGAGGGAVQARVSGALFGIRATISAVVHAQEGRLVAEPVGIPLGQLAAVTLFEDPSVRVEGVGLRVVSRAPLTYGLSFWGRLS